MKRILHVVSCLAFGGTEAFIMNHIRQFDAAEYQFDFMVFQKGEDCAYADEIKARGGKIFFSGVPAMSDLYGFTKRAVRLMKENGPYDAVHSHVNIQNGVVLRAAYKAGIAKRISHSHATVCFSRGIKSVTDHFKGHLIKKYATDFLACSMIAGNSLYGNDFFSAHGKMIFNGIRLSDFSVDDAVCQAKKREFDIPPECELIVGTISRFDANKNPLFTVKTFHTLLQYFPNACLLLGGADAGKLAETVELVNTLGIQDSVRWIGCRRDVPECLGIIDIYLIPSLYEGLPISLLEAQASRCFCVASAGISLQSSVVESSTLYLSLEDGPQKWAERIKAEYSQWEKPQKEYVYQCFSEKGFDIKTSYKKLKEVYDGRA